MKKFLLFFLSLFLLTGCISSTNSKRGGQYGTSSSGQYGTSRDGTAYCTVRWYNVNNDLIYSDQVKMGEIPVFTGEIPTKPSDVSHDYSFAGWYPEVEPVYNDVSYRPLFSSIQKYCTVTWKNWDGTTIYSERCECGSYAFYNSRIYAEPTKPSNERYDYEFVSWYPNINEGPLVEDQVFTAVFDEKVRLYEITWKNWNGFTLHTDSLPYGATPSYNLSTPNKLGDEQYSYTFSGWYPEIQTVTDNATYTATFSENIKTYTVYWYNYNNQLLKTDKNVPYGTTPVYTGSKPEHPSVTHYDYNFIGWSPKIEPITGDTWYTAQFEEVEHLYEIKWVNYDNKLLKTDYLTYGTKPEYSGETPIRTSNEQYTYSFSGWSPKITIVNGDATYTAQFDNQLNKYEVQWLNFDGTLLQSNYFEYGTTPSYSGVTPSKPSTEQYTYEFKGWSPEVTTVTGIATYVAVFEQNVRCYNIVWKNSDGSIIKTDVLAYGSTPIYVGEDPVKNSDSEYKYTFSGWSPEICVVEEDATYVAQFESSIKDYYTIRWYGANGLTAVIEQYQYGEIPSYKGSIPTKNSTNYYTYEFSGWSPSIEPVTCDKSYFPTFNQLDRLYTITWKNWDGTVLDVELYKYNQTPSFKGDTPTKESTAQYNYIFNGWSPSVSSVTKDRTYTAQYNDEIRRYTVTWANWDGTILEVDENVVYNYAKPTYDGETPVKERTLEDNDYRFVFTGWDPEIGKVQGDITYTAQFSREPLFEFYETSGKSYSLIKCFDNTISFVTLPETYRGINVTGINVNAFDNCTNLKTVTIPETISNITSIENGAPAGLYNSCFRGCSNLKTVYYPYFYSRAYSFRTIASYALEAVYYGTETSASHLFFLDVNAPVRKIVLTPSVTALTPQTSTTYRYFHGQVDVTMNSSIINWIGPEHTIADFWDMHPLKGKDVNLTFYGEFNFGGKSLVSPGVWDTYSEYFNVDWNIKNITFVDGFKDAPDRLFYCATLENINIGESCQYYSSENGIVYNKDKTKLIACPNGKNGMIVIPDSVNSIGNYAFAKCSNLDCVEMGGNVTTIGTLAFSNCSALLDYRGTHENWLALDGKSYVPSTYLWFNGDRVTTKLSTKEGNSVINDYEYYKCTSLSEVTFDSSVKNVNQYAFAYCGSLTNVIINDGCEVLDSYSFFNCTKLASIVIPVSMKKLAMYCFKDCTSLSAIFYEGTSEDYNKMTTNSEILKLLYFYSETAQSEPGYWHYVDGVPTIW